jgi:MFS superfamily sulfate permease-like transporter
LIIRHKLALPEYLVCLSTFVAIQSSNIEAGMAIGIVLALAAFTFSYSKSPAVLLPRVRQR